MKQVLFAAVVAVSVPALAQTPNSRVNPLLSPSPLPFQAPVFDRITDADFQPAIEEAMTQQLAEVDAIANDAAPPTFANTIEAMEKSGVLLRRVMAIFNALTDANTNPALQKVEAEEAPKLASHDDEIYLNAKLFARVKAIYDRRNTLALDPEATRLVELYYRDFVRSGALLNDADKTTLRALNREESTLSRSTAPDGSRATMPRPWSWTTARCSTGSARPTWPPRPKPPGRGGWPARGC
jgi:peptidyl-dipeptidase Dcp